jgi:hypothetical protein
MYIFGSALENTSIGRSATFVENKLARLRPTRHYSVQAATMSSGSQPTWQPPKDWQSRPVCVLGGGVLGRRIGACFVAAGHTVRIRDPSGKAREDGVAYIKTNISAFTALSQREAGKVEAVEDLAEAVKDCWLVIEAVPEVLKIKEETFADLEKYAPVDCFLATNSSSYKSGEMVGKIQDETKKRVFNAHFMMPPEVSLQFLRLTSAC